MKIGTTMYTVKFKDKIPCQNETVLASDLAYYLYYLDNIPEELSEWNLEDIHTKRKEDEEEFNSKSKIYSNLFKLRLTTNKTINTGLLLLYKI